MRYPRALAETALTEIRNRLPGVPLVACGSFRRGLPDVHDLDVVILAADGDLEALAQLVCTALPEVSGGRRILRGTVAGIPVDLYLCQPAELGAMTLFLTGSADFNVHCRRVAIRKGMSLSQYGLTNKATDDISEHASEEDLLNAIGIGWVAPADRSHYVATSSVQVNCVS